MLAAIIIGFTRNAIPQLWLIHHCCVVIKALDIDTHSFPLSSAHLPSVRLHTNILMLFLLLLFVGAAVGLPLSQQPPPPLFSAPHVFLTLSSVGGVAEGGALQDTLLELNWYGFSEFSSGDYIGLYSADPQQSMPPLPGLLTLVPLNASSAPQGYHKTVVRFGRPPLTTDNEGDNCLGYWIAYIRDGGPLASNCFRKNPRWMSGLRDVIGDKPLSSLMIPGTHDAGAIREYDGWAAENPVVRYSVCQEESFLRQFIFGVRYVDIRVSHYPATQEKWWINHGSVRFAPLATLFAAVRSFIRDTGEIIFMDFHGFPVGFDEADAGTTHSLLLDYVLAEVGELLLYEDMVSSGNPTPNDLWATNRSLILTYQVDSVSSSHPFLWPYLIHAWGDKNELEPLERYFEEEALPRYGCSGQWWSAMAEMTPTAGDVIGYPLRGLRGFAQMANIPLTYWWMRQEWYSRSMIVSTDFFLGNNIVEMSIEVNKAGGSCA